MKCEDCKHIMRYIDAGKLIDDIRPFAEYDSNLSNKDWVRRFEIAINAQPTADVRENVKGEWEHWGSPFSDESEVIDTIVCSVCGARFVEPKDETKGEYNYCPNCGARMMRGGNDD